MGGMDIAAGYKMTEIGVFPEDWEETTLGEIGSFSKGGGISRDESHSGSIPAIRYGELYIDQHDYIREFHSFISPKVAEKARLIKRGDLLFTASGETKEDIGKSVAYAGDKDAYAGGDLIVLTPKKELDPIFMGYLSNIPYVAKQKASRGQGDAVVHITARALSDIKIVIPPPKEQKRISKLLAQMDEIVDKLNELITKKKLLKEGVMQELLTGKTRLAGFSGEWVEKRLGDFGGIIRGVSYTPEQSSLSPKDNYICLLRSNNIQNGNMVFSDFVFVDKINVNEQQMVINNDILVCMANGSKQLVGKSAIIDESDEYTFGAFMGVFRCYKSKQAQFVISLFHSGTYRKQIEDILTGSAINNLNASSVESLTFLVPPTIEEQTAIADILSDLDAEIKALEAERDKYALIKQGMMQKLLTGQIRLK